MTKIMEGVALVGLIIVLIGIMPMIIAISIGNISTEAFTQAMKTAMPFFVTNLVIIAFASAFLER